MAPAGIKKTAAAVCGLIFWLLIWQIAAVRADLSFVLPTPLAVAGEMLQLLTESSFWSAVGSTLVRIAQGYAAGLAVGIALGIITALVPFSAQIFAPLMTALKSTPVASFVLVVWVFTGSSTLPFFTAFIMVLPITVKNTDTGIRQFDPALAEVCRVHRLPLRRRLTAFWLPSLAPYLSAAAVTSVGLAFKAGVAAEILAQTKNSVGREIYFAKAYFETERLFAWTLTVIVLSIAAEAAVRGAVLLMRGRRKHARDSA